MVRVISLWQPWATLWALGAKRGAKGKETRSWKCKPGPTLIHAAKRFDKWQRQLCLTEPFKSVLAANGYNSPDDLPLGQIVGRCDTVDCEQITETNIPASPERDFGDYTPGRFMWDSENNEPIEPFPAKGQQGFWNIDYKEA